MEYVPNELAKKKPIYLVKRKVAIGGNITIPQTAPKLPVVIKEATPEQYKELYELGFTRYIDKKKAKD